jgi:hypothetical protein
LCRGEATTSGHGVQCDAWQCREAARRRWEDHRMNWRKTFTVFAVASAIWICLCVAYAIARCRAIDTEKAEQEERIRSGEAIAELGTIALRDGTANRKRKVGRLAVLAGLLGISVVGSALSSLYKDTWRIVHEGHRIEVENRWTCARLFVNGELQDEHKGLTSRADLNGVIESGQGEGKRIRVSLSALFKPTCVINIDDSVVFRG